MAGRGGGSGTASTNGGRTADGARGRTAKGARSREAGGQGADQGVEGASGQTGRGTGRDEGDEKGDVGIGAKVRQGRRRLRVDRRQTGSGGREGKWN